MNFPLSLDSAAIGVYALNILLPLTAICLIALIAARYVFRYNPGVRYAICLAALVCALLSPLVVGIQHKLGYALVTVPLPRSFISSRGSVAAIVLPPDARPIQRPDSLRAEAPATSLFRQSTAPATQPQPPTTIGVQTSGIPVSTVHLHWQFEAIWIALLIWIAGIAVGLVRFVQGWILASRLNQNIRVWKAPTDTCDRIERVFGCPLPAIFTSPNVLSPLAVGLFRPKVILPEELSQTLSPVQLRHVLLHECAHIAFRHTLSGVIDRVVRLLFWPHPLVRLLSRELALAREEVCDNVASQEDGAACYARTLFLIAQGVIGAPNRNSALALLDASTSLEGRIAGLLNARRNRMVRMERWKLWVVAVVAGSTMAGAAIFRIVAAENKLNNRALIEQNTKASPKDKEETMNAAWLNSPMDRMDYAKTLADKHKFAEALKEYVWCLKEGDIADPPFVGVHGSFLMAEMIALGKKYPPAIAALKQYRDSQRDALDKKGASRDNAQNFIYCNENFDDEERTLAAYDELKISRPASAEMLFEDAAKQMVRKRRYADVVLGAGDITNRISQQLDGPEGGLSYLPDNADTGTFSYELSYLEDAAMYYEALVALDKKSEADAARDQILHTVPGPIGYLTLLRHARRADKPQAIQELLALARRKLKSAALKKVEQA